MIGIVYFLRIFLNLSLIFVLAVGSSVGAQEPPSAPRASSGSLQVTGTDGAPSLKVDFTVREVEASEIPAELEKALTQDEAETVIVSSDQDEVLAQASSKSVTLIPFGRAIRRTAELAGGLNSLLRSSGLYLANAFKNDKLGFGIATFSLGTEIVRWIHVSTASDFVVTSNIIYSILWSAIFVNKDTWSKATKPLQRTLRRLFRMSSVIPETPTASDIAMKFLSGLSLSLILNTGRTAIVGIDQLAQNVFDPLKLSMPYIMGTVMTAVGFSWSELIGSIDEKAFPRTKKITRFVMNSRSCLISYFAASAMLMNPDRYGLMPWITVSISGAIGLALYSQVKRVVPFVESIARKLMAFSSSAPQAARQCATLFSPATS